MLPPGPAPPLGASDRPPAAAGGRGRELIFARADNRPHWMRVADGDSSAASRADHAPPAPPRPETGPTILTLAAPGASGPQASPLMRTGNAGNADAAAAAAFLHAPAAPHPTGGAFGKYSSPPVRNETFPLAGPQTQASGGVHTLGATGPCGEASPNRGPQILPKPTSPFQNLPAQDASGGAPAPGACPWPQPPFPFGATAAIPAQPGALTPDAAGGPQAPAPTAGSALQEMQKRFEEQMRIQQQEILQQIMQQMQAQRDATAADRQGTDVAGKVGKPECYEAIGSTLWYRVETTTGLKYFYHKKTKKATWTCPPEIADLVAAIDDRMGGAAGKASPSPSSSSSSSSSSSPSSSSSSSSSSAPSGAAQGRDEERSEAREENGKRGRQSEEEGSSDSDSSDDEDVSEEMKQLKLQMQRYEDFKQMLRERNLGPFAHYEKVLPKLLFDPRFAAIPTEQRKRLFERCLKEIVAENRQGQKELIDAFRELMNELYESGHVHASSTVETLEKRCGHDPRWIAAGVPTADWAPIRKRLVEETIDRRRQEKNLMKNNIKRDFKKLMREKMAERPSDEWAALRKELRSHPQYLQLGSASEREKIFQQVCEELTFLNEEKKRNAETVAEDAETKRARLVKTEAAAAFM
nr:FF domain protein [Toxoplasma gondii TgCATBr9]